MWSSRAGSIMVMETKQLVIILKSCNFILTAALTLCMQVHFDNCIDCFQWSMNELLEQQEANHNVTTEAFDTIQGVMTYVPLAARV